MAGSMSEERTTCVRCGADPAVVVMALSSRGGLKRWICASRSGCEARRRYMKALRFDLVVAALDYARLLPPGGAMPADARGKNIEVEFLRAVANLNEATRGAAGAGR